LVAFHGCPLGIGTDIAGSIRIPAMCCGVYGFKPTANRLPYAGQTNPPGLIRVPGSIEPSAGPLGHSVQDLRVAMAAMMQLRPWLYDADAYDIPWRDPLPLEDAAAKPDGLGRKLTIGILPEDPAYPLHPPVRRAVQTAAAKLEKAGHRIVWLPPDADREVGLGMRIAFQFFGVGWEGGVPQLAEPPVASVAVGSHPFSKDPPPVPRDPSPIRFLGKLHAARTAFADAWRRAWKENGLDVVLAPGALSPAVPLDTYGLPTYTVMWNLIDVSKPVTHRSPT
jgi:amidase